MQQSSELNKVCFFYKLTYEYILILFLNVKNKELNLEEATLKSKKGYIS
jgi:hypothetical protein